MWYWATDIGNLAMVDLLSSARRLGPCVLGRASQLVMLARNFF